MRNPTPLVRGKEMTDQADTDLLLDKASMGDAQAVEQLFAQHRDRLRRMIKLRLDDQLSARLDTSDVIQETLLLAHRQLPRYLADRPIPFYPWLRRICWGRLLDLRDAHLTAKKRSVHREDQRAMPLSDKSAVQLVDRLLAREVSPSRMMIQAELRQRVFEALDQIRDSEREVLELRFLEDMSLSDTAATLGISEGAVSMRQLRALLQIRQVLRACDE